MNQQQRKHAANRIETIVNKNLPCQEDIPNVSDLHKQEVTNGNAQKLSEKAIDKLIKKGIDSLNIATRYNNPSIAITDFFQVNPKHKAAAKAAQKRNETVEKNHTDARVFILKKQDAIILGSSEEALAALKAAENYKA
tara:strand:+ start:5500 stop:5913 length:414 start_codon:yes stop_codon:yes gene_type:complete